MNLKVSHCFAECTTIYKVDSAPPLPPRSVIAPAPQPVWSRGVNISKFYKYIRNATSSVLTRDVLNICMFWEMGLLLIIIIIIIIIIMRLNKNLKIKIYKIIILPVVINSCETWWLELINLPLFSTVFPSNSCCFCPVGLSLL